MVWAVFTAYLVAGGYFSLILYLLMYHKWRCVMLAGRMKQP